MRCSHRHGRRIAVPARVALLDGAEDEEVGRFQIELLGRLLADARPRPTAARAQLLGLGQVVDDLAAFEVFGQRRAAVRIASGRWLLGGGRRRWRAAFAAATEPVLQGRVEFGLSVRRSRARSCWIRRAAPGPSPGAWERRSAAGHRERAWWRPCPLNTAAGRRVARDVVGAVENSV